METNVKIFIVCSIVFIIVYISILSFNKHPFEKSIENSIIEYNQYTQKKINELNKIKKKQEYTITSPKNWTLSFWIKYTTICPEDIDRLTCVSITPSSSETYPFITFHPQNKNLISIVLKSESGSYKTTENNTYLDSSYYTKYKHFVIVQNIQTISIYEDGQLYIQTDEHQNHNLNASQFKFVDNNYTTYSNKNLYNYSMNHDDIYNLYQTEYKLLYHDLLVRNKKESLERSQPTALERGKLYSKFSLLEKLN